MFKTSLSTAIAAAGFILTNVAMAQGTRDQIEIVGAYTGVPLATAVAERFTKATSFKAPKIQPNATGGGLKAICGGTGVENPDITTATRRIRTAELELCEKNGVKELLEMKIGNDALVVARAASNPITGLSRKDLFLAMAKDVPDPKGAAKLIPNPYKTWKEINPAFPDSKIQLTGPGSSIGSYDALINAIMVAGCKQFNWLGALEASDPQAFEAACKTFRKDGAYNEFSNYDTVTQEIKNNADLVGIVGFSIARRAGLNSMALDGIEPTLPNVSRQEYALTFPFYVYANKAHIGAIPGLKEYLTEFVSENALSVTGYLFAEGVVPMPVVERQKMRADTLALKPLTLEALKK